MELQLDRYADAGSFLNAAGPWLATAEVENNVMLTIASSIVAGTRTLKERPYFAVAVDGNESSKTWGMISLTRDSRSRKLDDVIDGD